MEDYFFENDIVLAFKMADKFPDGVQEAFETLHEVIPFSTNRKFLSISWMNTANEIVYLAGAEILDNESFPTLETFTFKKGTYRGTIIEDFMRDIPKIGLLFQELCRDPELDPAGYCVEWYFNEKDVKCMVKLR
jgi:predicted transcriptional regulator YdeE